MTLLELAVLFGGGGTRLNVPVQELLAAIDGVAGFQIVPIDVEIAMEVVALGSALRDPADRTIVATARVRRLRLVTSDRRIIESKLVTVVE
jgi:PIN domain nuclease of toxin-antitoxin system